MLQFLIILLFASCIVVDAYIHAFTFSLWMVCVAALLFLLRRIKNMFLLALFYTTPYTHINNNNTYNNAFKSLLWAFFIYMACFDAIKDLMFPWYKHTHIMYCTSKSFFLFINLVIYIIYAPMYFHFTMLLALLYYYKPLSIHALYRWHICMFTKTNGGGWLTCLKILWIHVQRSVFQSFWGRDSFSSNLIFFVVLLSF